MKKLFLLFVAMCYMMTFSAYAAKGNCGDHGSNVKWELDNKTGVLTIYGTGKMKTYYYYVNPHSPFRNNKKIKHIIVKEGVTHVGRDAFGGCENLLSVTFPKSLTSMGGDVFYKEQHNPSVIFYYAGHGIPDEASKSAYLLPVDGIVSNLNTCFKLDELYATLGAMPAERISVFMDACFSGSKRENGMLASARAVALKTRPGEPQGKMVVFSAAQGDETAYPYREKQHGMFTYYLLKKLQETQGNVSLVELGEYVTTHVQQQSVLENSKVQTPCVTPSTAVVDNWRSWTLK
ncbi:MAG: caspase family protein [Paludibacteraceae bacterium]|nr:caspase family protein [Paludibacteraceae bacterium]